MSKACERCHGCGGVILEWDERVSRTVSFDVSALGPHARPQRGTAAFHKRCDPKPDQTEAERVMEAWPEVMARGHILKAAGLLPGDPPENPR